MHKIWVVVRREFVEKVRNKWFVIATVLGPVLMAAMIIVPTWLLVRTAGGTRVAVVDVSSDGFGLRARELLGSPLRDVQYLAVPLERLSDVSDSLVAQVGEKAINGFVIVTDETVSDGKVEYRGSNVSSQTETGAMRRLIQEAVLTERLQRVGVDPTLVADARIPVDLTTVNIRGGEVTEQSGEAAFVLAYVMWFILYFALIVYGVQVAGAVVEEKSSRIIEVLVSSLRPFQLLAGKVIGVGAVGLFQLLIWAAVARVLIDQQGFFLRLFGVELPQGQAFALPEVPLDTIGVLLLYFVLGFFLYSTMFAAVGAMSSSESEMRQAQQPVVILIVLPALLSFGTLNDPDGTVGVVLSLVPFTAPLAMPMRWGVSAVPPGELAMSVGLLLLTAFAVTWVAARIYRVGILMYGKRPGLRELVRWVRVG
jgi:ABC-2 type transport system permease protein